MLLITSSSQRAAPEKSSRCQRRQTRETLSCTGNMQRLKVAHSAAWVLLGVCRQMPAHTSGVPQAGGGEGGGGGAHPAFSADERDDLAQQRVGQRICGGATRLHRAERQNSEQSFDSALLCVIRANQGYQSSSTIERKGLITGPNRTGWRHGWRRRTAALTEHVGKFIPRCMASGQWSVASPAKWRACARSFATAELACVTFRAGREGISWSESVEKGRVNSICRLYSAMDE